MTHLKQGDKPKDIIIACYGCGENSYKFCMCVDEMRERGMSEDEAYKFAGRLYGFPKVKSL